MYGYTRCGYIRYAFKERLSNAPLDLHSSSARGVHAIPRGLLDLRSRQRGQTFVAPSSP